MLPITRLVGAGATPAEVDHLTAEHDASSLEAQESVLERLRGMSEGGIREWLDELRAAGVFGDVRDAPADDPVEAESDDSDDDEGDGEPTEGDSDVEAEADAPVPVAAARPRAPRKPKA